MIGKGHLEERTKGYKDAPLPELTGRTINNIHFNSCLPTA